MDALANASPIPVAAATAATPFTVTSPSEESPKEGGGEGGGVRARTFKQVERDLRPVRPPSSARVLSSPDCRASFQAPYPEINCNVYQNRLDGHLSEGSGGC